jgi:peptide/nickel transport system substrate-binding protein
MKRRTLACLLVSVAAACSKVGSLGGTAERHAWTQPGVLRVAVTQEPKSLDPLLATTTTDGFVARLMFEPLLTADRHGNPLPMLASRVPTTANGGISRDGLTVTYRLRPDAKWSDGVAVTSSDVRWSWEALVDPNDNVISRHGYDLVRSVEAPDAHTVVVRLKRRFAPFVNTFFAESDQPYGVAPAHVLAKYANINQVPFNQAPTVSDGPFRFASWQHGDRIVFVANPTFFEGKPALDRVVVNIVPDENTGVNLLRTHAIDYLYQPSITTYPSLRELPDSKLVWVNANAYEGLAFNLTHPNVSDARVRLAVAHAVDKAGLVNRLTYDKNKLATEDIPDWMWAFNPNVKSYPYDLGVARRLLRQAGYEFGADGLARKNGQALALLLVTDSATATHRQESLILQAALRAIGIAVEVKYYPIDMLYATASLGGIMQTGRFDMLIVPWYGGIDPDDSSQFTCANIPPGGYNASHYCNPEMEAAQSDALNSYDQAMRAVAYGRIQHLLARDNPIIFFWWNRQQEGISVDFRGFDPNPVTESWNAWKWRI